MSQNNAEGMTGPSKPKKSVGEKRPREDKDDGGDAHEDEDAGGDAHEDEDAGGPSVRFECETCGKAFSQNGHMARHMLTHTGEREIGRAHV